MYVGTMNTSSNDSQERLVVLFDDNKEFTAGYSDNAVVLKTVADARAFFEQLQVTRQTVAELWLDFVIGDEENVTDAFSVLPVELVERVFYHSNSFVTRFLVESRLKDQGFVGELELPMDYPFVLRPDSILD